MADEPVDALTCPPHAPSTVSGSASSPTFAKPLAVNVIDAAGIDAGSVALVHALAIAARHASAAQLAVHCAYSAPEPRMVEARPAQSMSDARAPATSTDGTTSCAACTSARCASSAIGASIAVPARCTVSAASAVHTND